MSVPWGTHVDPGEASATACRARRCAGRAGLEVRKACTAAERPVMTNVNTVGLKSTTPSPGR
jgi:hypothetical protein